MFLKNDGRTGPRTTTPDGLERVVSAQLVDADRETIEIVTAIAGLLAAVAYADRHVSPEETQALREALSRIHGLDEPGVHAIETALCADVVRIATVERPRFTRALVEHADRALRLEVLAVLVELAAADGVLTLSEVSTLRSLATALGLDQSDYNLLQERHKDRLSTLK